MNVTIFSRKGLINNLLDEDFTKNCKIISINDFNYEKEEIENYYSVNENDENNLLTLVFKDDYPNPGDFTQEVAKTIIEFSKQAHAEKQDLIIHCWAGISRSGAVAKWANDFFELNIEEWNNYSKYNKIVHHILTETSKTLK